jgi:MFS family permease
MVVATFGPTLPALAEHTRSSLGEISILFTARSLGHILGALYIGRYYDRFPGHYVLGVSLVVMALVERFQLDNQSRFLPGEHLLIILS